MVKIVYYMDKDAKEAEDHDRRAGTIGDRSEGAVCTWHIKHE